MRSGSFSKIVVVVVECAWLVGTASQAGMAAEKDVFLVPVSQGSILEGICLSGCNSGWPNDSNKAAVIALDASRAIPEEVEDYLVRYSPGNTYLIDCAVDPGYPNEGLVAYWPPDEGGDTMVNDYMGTWNGTFTLVIIPVKMNH